MTDLKLNYPPGATPLDPDELNGLKINYITTQGELNEAEQENIIKANVWCGKNIRKVDVLSEDFIRKLHSKMFSDVWKWAGKYRTSDKSIGVHWPQVSFRLLRFLHPHLGKHHSHHSLRYHQDQKDKSQEVKE
jgi:fido (protein-threonine AMPylation protein)